VIDDSEGVKSHTDEVRNPRPQINSRSTGEIHRLRLHWGKSSREEQDSSVHRRLVHLCLEGNRQCGVIVL